MFNFSFDKRVIYIILGCLILSTVIGYLSDPNKLLGLIISIPAVLIAITFHEFAHAFAADKLGDDTPRRQGRLSLNPLHHLDPVGSLLLLFAGFGWGKPVEINPRNFNRNISMEKADAIVSIAGPLMNLFLAIVFTLIYCAIVKFAPKVLIGNTGGAIQLLLMSIVSINIGLGVFNLIPLPPLDGSKVIMPFLPAKAKSFFIEREQIFYIVFVILWITGLAGYIISPAITFIYKWIINLGLAIFGL